MAATRRKAIRQQAPQTIDEAVAALAEYADILLGVEELQADAEASIAAIKAERDRMTAPMEQRAKDLFLELRAWWAVAGPELTDGKRKSVELAGCLLGERTTPPSLKMPTPAAEAPVLLINAGFGELCRHKVEVDKQAVLGVLRSEARLSGEILLQEALAELGFKAVQKEEFFIDRAGEKPAAVEIVKEQAA